MSKKIGAMATSDASGVLWFAAIGVGLYFVATRAKGAVDAPPGGGGATAAEAAGGAKAKEDEA